LVLLKVACFWQMLFCILLHFEFYGAFAVLIYCKMQFGRVLHKFAHFGLVFRICPLLLFLIFCWLFVLFSSPAKCILDLFFG